MGNKQSSSKNSFKKKSSFKGKLQSSKESMKQLFNQGGETLDPNIMVTSYPMNTNGDYIVNSGPIVVDLHSQRKDSPSSTSAVNRNLNVIQKNTINDILLQNIKQASSSTTTRTGNTPITPHNEQLKRDLIANMFITPQLNIDLDQISQNAPVKPKCQPQEDADYELFFDPRSPTIKRIPISKESLQPFADLNKFMELSPLNLEDERHLNKKDPIVVLSNTRHNIIDILDCTDMQLDDDVMVNNSLFEDDDLIKKVFVLPSPIQPYDPNNGELSNKNKEATASEALEDDLPPSPPRLSNLPPQIMSRQEALNILADDGIQLVLDDDIFGMDAIDIINLELENSKLLTTNSLKSSTTPKLMIQNHRQRDLPGMGTLRTPKRKNSLNPSSIKGYVSPSPLQNALAQHNDQHLSNLSCSTNNTTANSTPYMTPKTPTNDEDLNPTLPPALSSLKVVNKENQVETNKKKSNIMTKPNTLNKKNANSNVNTNKNGLVKKSSDHNDLRAKSIQRLDGALVNISNRVR